MMCQYMTSYNIINRDYRDILQVHIPFPLFQQRAHLLIHTTDFKAFNGRISVYGMTLTGPQGDYLNCNANSLVLFWNVFEQSKRNGDYEDLSFHLQSGVGSGTTGFWTDIIEQSDFDEYIVTMNYVVQRGTNLQQLIDHLDRLMNPQENEVTRAELEKEDAEAEQYDADKLRAYFKKCNINHQHVIQQSHLKILNKLKRREKKQQRELWNQIF